MDIFGSFDELEQAQRGIDKENIKQWTDFRRNGPSFLEDTVKSPIERDPYHQVYKQSEGIDVPLIELIKRAKEQMEERRQNPQTIRLTQNIRIKSDNYDIGNYAETDVEARRS